MILPKMIDYQLTSFHNAVVFQILAQDEDQRNGKFTAKNGFTVMAEIEPELQEGVINLREEEVDADFDLCAIYFESNEHRDEYIKNLHQALKEWSESGGFAESN